MVRDARTNIPKKRRRDGVLGTKIQPGIVQARIENDVRNRPAQPSDMPMPKAGAQNNTHRQVAALHERTDEDPSG